MGHSYMLNRNLSLPFITVTLNRPVVPLYARPNNNSGNVLYNDCDDVLSVRAKLDTSERKSVLFKEKEGHQSSIESIYQMFTDGRLSGVSKLNHNLVSCCCGFIHANRRRLSP